MILIRILILIHPHPQRKRKKEGEKRSRTNIKLIRKISSLSGIHHNVGISTHGVAEIDSVVNYPRTDSPLPTLVERSITGSAFSY